MITWPNNCLKEAVEALRFLSENPRPAGGQEPFNAEHLLQIASELELGENQRLRELATRGTKQ